MGTGFNLPLFLVWSLNNIYCSEYDKGQDLSCMPFINRVVKIYVVLWPMLFSLIFADV